MRPIFDGLTKAQRHRIKKRQRGICWNCPRPALDGFVHCLDCLIQARERQRTRDKYQRRYSCAHSYFMERQRPVRALLAE